ILLLTVSLALLVLISCIDNSDFGGENNGGTNTSTSTNTNVNDESSNSDTSSNIIPDTDTSTNTDTNVSTDTNTNIDTDTNTNTGFVDTDPIKDELGLLYALKKDNTLSLVAYESYEGMPTILTVPSKVGEYTVTEIGSFAFNGYGEIASALSTTTGFVTIRLPETVTKICKDAFSNCADVKVQFDSTNATITLEEWVEILEIVPDDSHNKANTNCNCDSCHQVLDTIMSKRPAIGWYRYVK
ncbi:MAG: hypothetical protein II980_05705, partial [Clostridia bacterium]|nr:hypothetical protein [Clostridia bacterium]